MDTLFSIKLPCFQQMDSFPTNGQLSSAGFYSNVLICTKYQKPFSDLIHTVVTNNFRSKRI
ncbi:hypothetical protein BCY89_02395 [Sphingobacterium siyangense]|uniref:Uncharacterized protein n=1 Tax=Sphingobacterium siyangense TaxID=459529 RepID=A0A420GAZ0_9SPHI|nr:hypothetical protein BCY89_02395 [Sphingobacterium siyangense]